MPSRVESEKKISSKSSFFPLKFAAILFLVSAGLIGQNYFSQKWSQAGKPVKPNMEALKRQNATLELHCTPSKYQRHLTDLAQKKYAVCLCRPLTFFQGGCGAKIEVLSRKPFVVKVHGYFKDKSARIGAYADKVTMRPVMFGDEYGRSWVSQYINSEDGVLPGDMPVVQEISRDLARSMGLVYPCGGTPGAAIVRYRQGGFVGLHYDAPDLRVEKKLGYWLGARVFRATISWLEDCRHFYQQYNIWKCLYLAWRGQLESSTSWDNYRHGPQVATILIQLSNMDGGETYFPLVNLSVPTRQGDVLLWQNIDDTWVREPLSMHGGCPVLSKEKLIVVTFMPGKCNTFEQLAHELALSPLIKS